uniref:Calpain catalytic domain-containing protein n=1 Tax=Amphiprion ocellaris TaxID=80972 RepID=A0A3Q1AP35_AMPOC
MPPPGVCLNIMEARSKQDGYGKFTSPDRFFGQDFQQLKQYCLIKGVRYIDDMFPPDRSSIGQGLLSPSDLSRVVWLRPAKIVANPSFVLDGISRFDFGQGILGDCWFLASLGALTFQNHIFGQVVPLEQTFDQSYCGIFHFRFWRFGRWVDVVIDDKLPTINGRLIFVHSKNQNEFWPALLEKAYAKVCGSYTDMNAGTPAEALMDFTGGVHMCILLSEPPPNLWELMCRAGQSKTLMSCGTHKGATSANTVLPNGLVQSHAYTVTGVKQMVSRGQPVNLVRLWNPWGRGEWNGDWSDRSPLWQTVSPQDREMCLSVADDGEFWMTLQDFCKFFMDLDICGLSPDFLDGSSSGLWNTSIYEGRWVAGTTAGGCINNRDSFWTNPQFRVKVSGEYSEKEGEKNILVSLIQKPDKRNRRLVQNLHIGFTIFEVNSTLSCKFPASFFNTHAPVGQTKTYFNAREVMEFMMLKPGEYLIVPSTFNRNESASFVLTIHSKIETHMKDGFICSLQVDAEQLQRLLNENILKGLDSQYSSFSSIIVPLLHLNIDMDDSPKTCISLYQDIFYLMDVSRTGTLSLTELRNAFIAAEFRISDDMLNLMALRYGASSGHMTLESFISLILRLDCMNSKWNK